MKRLLTLKPWQLFLVLCSPWFLAMFMPAVLISGYFKTGMTLQFGLTFLTMAFLLGWFYVLGTNLQQKLPTKLQGKMKLKFFKFNLAFPLIYIATIVAGIGAITIGEFNPTASAVLFILPAHFYAMFCMFYSLYFVAKSLLAAEEGQFVGFDKFAGPFFLLWFYPVGVWFLQPRIKKLFDA